MVERDKDVRVAVKVKQNKEDILVLFTEIPSKNVKMQLNKCRRCFNNFRDEEKTGVNDQNDQNFEAEEEEEKEREKEKEKEKKDDAEKKEDQEEGEEGEDEKKHDEGSGLVEGKRHTSRKGGKKKFKPYSTNILLLLLKFLFFVALLEGYFLLSYLKADSFLSRALDLINELGGITHRSNSNGFLYRTLQEYMGTNGTATILNQGSEKYLIDKINNTIREQEDFLKQHSENLDSNDADYNEYFDKLIYENVCQLLFKDASKVADCQTYQVLLKGLHSANVAFWDTIREFANDFKQLGASRTLSTIKTKFSDSRLIEMERLEARYFSYAYQQLQGMLSRSLESKFSSEYDFLLILFVCYLLLLVLLYFFAWRMFVESTRHSLWITKSMLAIIPVETIKEVRSIREFMIATSKTMLIGLGSD